MDGLKPRIPALLEKFERGAASPEEMDELDVWFDSFAGNPDLTDGMTADQRIKAKAALMARIDRKLDGFAAPSRRLVSLGWIRLAAAAMVLAVLAIGGYSLLRKRPPQSHTLDQLAVDFQAGTNRATLTLADGRVLDLDEAKTGIIVGKEDITYNDGASLGFRPADTLILTTPKGGTYQITLPDGSRVWLNAASTLKYPSRFSGTIREVILEGEGYFEIKSIPGAHAPVHSTNPDGARVSRVPFNVQTSGQTVEVLGTEFNISAYADNPETKTTLVEGKVKVGNGLPASVPALLTAGQQATTRGATIDIQQVDTAPYIAWRSGFFHFVDADIRTVLQEFGRWYDLDIVFDGLQTTETFTGRIPRSWSFARVMKLMKPFESTKISIEGRRVMVSQ